MHREGQEREAQRQRIEALTGTQGAQPQRGPQYPQHAPVTEEAIHYWGEGHIDQQYKDHPVEVRAAAREAMRRHRQQGTSARNEAQALNTRFGLGRHAQPAGHGPPRGVMPRERQEDCDMRMRQQQEERERRAVGKSLACGVVLHKA